MNLSAFKAAYKDFLVNDKTYLIEQNGKFIVTNKEVPGTVRVEKETYTDHRGNKDSMEAVNLEGWEGFEDEVFNTIDEVREELMEEGAQQ